MIPLRSDYLDIAIRRVRLGLLISEVGRVNAIEVTEEEANMALYREAQQYPGKERQVFEFYQKSPEAMANLRAPLFEDKVVDFIIDLALLAWILLRLAIERHVGLFLGDFNGVDAADLGDQ